MNFYCVSLSSFLLSLPHQCPNHTTPVSPRLGVKKSGVWTTYWLMSQGESNFAPKFLKVEPKLFSMKELIKCEDTKHCFFDIQKTKCGVEGVEGHSSMPGVEHRSFDVYLQEMWGFVSILSVPSFNSSERHDLQP